MVSRSTLRFAPLGVLLALTLPACGRHSAPGANTGPDSVAGLTRAPIHQVEESALTFVAGGREVPWSLVRPRGGGPFPGLLLLAGSGPTDRDWNSPLLPGNNGSARLLANELARRGVVVLRFDKAGSGQNAGPPVEEWTLDTYRDEARAALSLLRARADVHLGQVFVAGHSEGGIHATRLAQASPGEIAGILFLSSVSRSMADTMLTQLEGNLRSPMANLPNDMVEAEMASLRTAFGALLAGEPFDPRDASTIPQLQALVGGLMNPATLALTRGLLGYDPAQEAARLPLPFFVLNGGKDIQVDAAVDGRLLVDTLTRGGREVHAHVAADADHVLKHQPLSLAELRADLAAVQAGYNAAERSLDPDVVDAIVGWLASRRGSSPVAAEGPL